MCDIIPNLESGNAASKQILRSRTGFGRLSHFTFLISSNCKLNADSLSTCLAALSAIHIDLQLAWLLLILIPFSSLLIEKGF
ncbi:hypothetical protein BH18THE2_BH18THE2_20110 [soil metagenome]